MEIEEIKERLRKKAIIFETGGKRPIKNLSESWIGRVGFCLGDEVLPVDSDGNPMYPVAMLFLNCLSYLPLALQGINMIAIYFSKNIYNHMANDHFEGYYCIREYKADCQLVPCDFTSEHIRPLPLFPKEIDNDYPTWDGGGIPLDLENEILRLEEDNGIEYFDNIVEDLYSMHKIGGYPCFCQSGVSFGDEYEFVLQISSDPKAHLNIVDSGSFYFYRNIYTGEWKLHCDFY